MLDLLLVVVIALFVVGVVLKVLGVALETAGNVYRWASEDPETRQYRHVKPLLDREDWDDD